VAVVSDVAQPVEAVVALGANLGDRERTLREAVAALGSLPGTTVVAVSDPVETDPVGGPDQPDYLNAVAVLTTPLSPRELLDALHRVEADHGRERVVRWGARTLDLDLIAYGGVSRTDDPRLILPHPRAHEREFVLRPLCDVEPGLVLAGRTAAELLAELEPQGVEPAGVELSWSPPPAAEV
jgi:dihydroneopterin aldolase/2-amino-4-hydroxy-6-hydroxymethyldihydropteridine diphosphokinase